MIRSLTVLALAMLIPAAGHGQGGRSTWNEPQDPIQLYGNVYYVGTRGLTALLVTSPQGHVLIDGTTTESAPRVIASIKAAGFRIEDVKLILNSHAHFDHAGGISALQRASGARVALRPWSARTLAKGAALPDDPQYGALEPMEPVKNVEVVDEGQVVKVGPLALTAHATGGHTPGGTSWSWQSCQGGRCLNVVYADSISPVSADAFLYTRSKEYPTGLADFEKSFSTLSTIACDVLLTPHPEASDLWGRLERRKTAGSADPLIDPGACRRYADTGRANLQKRLAREKESQPQP